MLTRDKQELSYRKQIAPQQRTQYVECIYDLMTLKSRLKVTQGHPKGTIWKFGYSFLFA